MCYNSPGPRCAHHIKIDNAANPDGVQESIPTRVERAQQMAAWKQDRLVIASDLTTPLNTLTKMREEPREPRAARLAACKNLVIRHPHFKDYSLNAVIGMAGMRPAARSKGAEK